MPEEREHMRSSDLRRIRSELLRVSQAKLAEQLIDPNDGNSINHSTVSRWEAGSSRIPLWAANSIRKLANAAAEIDRRGDA